MLINPFKLALMSTCSILLLFFTIAACAAPAPSPLPGDSLYQLEMVVTDQLGQTYPWGNRRGQVQVVSMFYTSCRYVCPLIVDTMKKVEHELPEVQRARLHFTLVSFDPARDDVAALASVAAKRKLDPARWHLLRMDPDRVRELASALDIQYRRLPDGEFNHASRLLLLDTEGRILARSDQLGKLDTAFVAATLEVLATGGLAKSAESGR